MGYAPVINAAVLSVYCHVTDVAMLARVAIHAVVAVATVWSKCVHTYQSECAIIYYVQYGANVCTLLPTGVLGTTLVHMHEFPPPWDPIMHDVTRLQLNQLFVGLAIFGSVC